MTDFEFSTVTDLPHVAFIRSDHRYDIAVERTPEGLEVRVWPITNGEIWFDPYDTFTVSEQAVVEFEQQMEE
jgi:hypothetical protein